MVDIICFLYLSIEDYNGVMIIAVTDREHGKKIQLTSHDYLDLCALLVMKKFGVTG